MSTIRSTPTTKNNPYVVALTRPSVFSAVLDDGTVIRVPDGQPCRCGRFRRPSDVERTGNGLRMLCGRCHDLVFEVDF
jgi:hypothetical protein